MRTALALAALLLVPPLAAADLTVVMRGPLHLHAPAVGETADGRVVGALADVYVTVAPAPGGAGGGVFLDTRPLLQLDMQGSARMAARVASSLAGANATDHDVFIAFRSGGNVIGGPSAGALMSAMILAAISGHAPEPDVTMTGAVLPDGSVGPVGGVPEKAQAAAARGKRLFLYPAGQETVARAGGQLVDLPTWCRDQLALTCRPVATVEEAYAQFTGFALERPPLGDPGPERSSAVLAPAAQAMLANASALSAEAEAALAAVTVQPDLQPAVDQARQRRDAALAAAYEARNRSEHYTASSKAFQAGVEARALLAYAGWEASGRDIAFVENERRTGAQEAAEATRAALARPPTTVSQLQALGAAQTRAREAERLVADARNATTVPAALRDLAFARERAQTVHMWLSIGNSFQEGPAVRADRLAEAAERAVESAADSVAYAAALVSQYAPGADVPRLQELLVRARAEKDAGLYAAALFTAVEADVRAGLLFAAALRSVPASTLERSREAAADAVTASRARGVEPVLAASYLQFGDSLRNETPPNLPEAYVFYQLARSVGRLPEVLDLDGSAGSARFAPFLDPAPRLRVPAAWMPAFLALGVALGVVGAVLALTRKE